MDLINGLNIVIDDAQPLASQLANQLTWMIASGQLPPGSRLPSVRHLADHLGIHLHTVRAAYRILEQDELILTQQGKGSVVVEFDSLKIAARGSNLRSNTVGIIVPDSANPFYPAVISGIIEVATRNHTLLITCDTRESHERGRDYLDMLIAKNVDGLIIAPFGLGLDSCFASEGEEEACYPVPIVYIDRPDERGYRVLMDTEHAGFAATGHLIEHGYRRIAVISGSLNIPTLREVFTGSMRAFQKHDLTFEPAMLYEADFFTYAEGYRAAQQFLDYANPPDAIFAAGDLFAIGAMRAIRDRGLRIPDDIAVVGYNDIDVAAYTDPALTTVSTPTRQLGISSMELLHRLINGEKVKEPKIVLPTRLIIRESCGCGK